MRLGNIELNRYVAFNVNHRSDEFFTFSDSGKYHYGGQPYKRERDVLEDMTKEVAKHLSVISNSAEIDPKKIGKVYISKSAVLPRYKLKYLKDEYGVSIVRDPSKADSIIISRDEITQLSDSHYSRNFYLRDNVLEYLEQVTLDIVKKSYQRGSSWYLRSFKEDVSAEKCFEKIQDIIQHIKLLPDHIKVLQHRNVPIFSILEETLGEIPTPYDRFTYTFDCNEINNLITTYEGKQVYTDSAIESFLGSGALDHDSYDMIQKLFVSRDPGNIDLGLTMMANCTFESSKPYLMLLLTDWYAGYRDRPYVKSVAFKSLLKFMEFERWTSYSIDGILTYADDNNMLTDELKAIMRKRYLADMNSALNKHRWFKITQIELERPNDTDKGRN